MFSAPLLLRALPFLVLLVSLTVMRAEAQHPLVGTWEMVTLKGIDADGSPFFFDTTAVRETKIITPTHYMLIAWDVDGDSLTFNRTMAGEVRLENERYIEIPTQASVQIFENVKVNFTWKLEGDIFTQSGTIVRPDGKKVTLEALVFRRVTNVNPQSENPAIGTWRQVTSSYGAADGKKRSLFNAGDTRMLVVTPTHWMRMDHRNNKFDGVLYGTYSHKGNDVTSITLFSTHPFRKGEQHTFMQTMDGNQLHMNYSGKSPEGEPATFFDVYERR